MARQFGDTWWGRAWIDAVENRARLDPNRLPRGRTYARHGHVLSISTESGAIRAEVQGSRRRPYRVDIRFRTLDDAEWETVVEVIVAKAARAAALLDGELDRDLVADVAAAGVDLLPHAGELQPRCSCPDWADPCKHSAAVCYLVADELDADPFELLRLRGRTRDEILATVRRRRSGPDGGTAGAMPAADWTAPDGECGRRRPGPVRWPSYPTSLTSAPSRAGSPSGPSIRRPTRHSPVPVWVVSRPTPRNERGKRCGTGRRSDSTWTRIRIWPGERHRSWEPTG